MPSINRRELLQAILGASAAAGLAPHSGCRTRRTSIAGKLLGQDLDFGHRIRQPQAALPEPTSWQRLPVAIVGGGIAGLSAGWGLLKADFQQFSIFELESMFGGTSRSSAEGKARYPWAAHYITKPMPENLPLIRLLQEMGVVEHLAADGSPVIAEQYLCREPEERLYYQGRWIEGLYPLHDASEEDERQLAEFQAAMRVWSQRVDSEGKRFFAIPIAHCSENSTTHELDQVSMHQWMQGQGWNSERLQWYVDYACRDDYGLTSRQTSAWAGIFYFAARLQTNAQESQDVITWPEGNGRIVDYLTDQLTKHLRPSQLVVRIQTPESKASPTENDAFTRIWTMHRDGRVDGYLVDHLIFAAPQFIARHVIQGYLEARPTAAEFQYGSWIVANIHLRSRPKELDFPLAWDNVLYGSKSLGYVVSTHQAGLDHGPSIWTWYYPITDDLPANTRKQLQELEHKHWVDVVLTDLETAHPDIRGLISRMDVMRWGHAMVQPTVGFLWGNARRAASQRFGPIHFANTDLSGVALMEEAFYHGFRASQEVAVELNTSQL